MNCDQSLKANLTRVLSAIPSRLNWPNSSQQYKRTRRLTHIQQETLKMTPNMTFFHSVGTLVTINSSSQNHYRPRRPSRQITQICSSFTTTVRSLIPFYCSNFILLKRRLWPVDPKNSRGKIFEEARKPGCSVLNNFQINISQSVTTYQHGICFAIYGF